MTPMGAKITAVAAKITQKRDVFGAPAIAATQ
jgi:hypothetical protein